MNKKCLPVVHPHVRAPHVGSPHVRSPHVPIRPSELSVVVISVIPAMTIQVSPNSNAAVFERKLKKLQLRFPKISSTATTRSLNPEATPQVPKALYTCSPLYSLLLPCYPLRSVSSVSHR